MMSWLKFFGLSFFSDKIAKEARIRGIMNCVLGFVLALVFIYCGVLSANTVPFYTHYKNASGFKAFFGNVTEKADLQVNGGRLSANGVINTFNGGEDAEEYALNGYSLVIDTRPSSAYAVFEAYCAPKAGGGGEISYEEYLALSDEAKGNYEFGIRYTPEELVLTEEMISGFESYLNSSENEEIKKQYSAILGDKENLTEKDYRHKIYALYIKAYYPDITAYERAGEVPQIRSYYYRNYLNSNDVKDCMFIFDDVLFGFFETDGGIEVTFYGSFGKIADGAVTVDNADKFIKSSFSGSVSVSATVYFMNIIRFIPVVVFIPLILALIAMLVLKLIKDSKYKKYTTCLKILCSYLAVASLLTALILFICGFFVSSGTLNTLPLIVFASVMAVRTAVLLTGEYIRLKKTAVEASAE